MTWYSPNIIFIFSGIELDCRALHYFFISVKLFQILFLFFSHEHPKFFRMFTKCSCCWYLPSFCCSFLGSIRLLCITFKIVIQFLKECTIDTPCSIFHHKTVTDNKVRSLPVTHYWCWKLFLWCSCNSFQAFTPLWFQSHEWRKGDVIPSFS